MGRINRSELILLAYQLIDCMRLCFNHLTPVGSQDNNGQAGDYGDSDYS